MMKKLKAFSVLLLLALSTFAQVKIHSHNDYLQPQRFKTAYDQRVYEIEADVFEVNGVLVVAHAKKEINSSNTLEKLYLQPIDSLFKLYQGRVSDTDGYTFTLMIDFKTPWETTYPILKREIEKYQPIFDRSSNKKAVQIVISGNRPEETLYHTFPKWLYFDGLPNVVYQKRDLKKITMISDNFRAHSKWNGHGEMPQSDQLKLKKIIDQANKIGKPLRFWAAPDTQEAWQTLHQLGAQIINTDKILACKTFFNDIK